MAAMLTPSGGHFLEGVELEWTLTDDVAFINYTDDGVQPAISTYIAYDTLVPPNPFIAVTQDGRGNVVYDGGFPKIYNHNAPAVGTTFSGLPASYKYFHNAINFVSNPVKVGNGVKKMLVLGDAIPSESYSVIGRGGSDFQTSFEVLASSTGYELIIKDRSHYGGSLNPTLQELEEYNLVILMSSVSRRNDYITGAAINNFTTYRENGNGLIFITDHGPVLGSTTDAAKVTSGFFQVANRVIVNFGAWFSGNYNRTPVNVGHIRRTYGDHPLYNGMTDDESISAGGSESRVFVAEYIPYTPDNIPSIDLYEPGVHTVSVLVIMKDGTMVTERYLYTVSTGEVYRYLNADGVPADETIPTFDAMIKFSVDVTVSNIGTMRGGVFKNGLQVGVYEYNGTASDIQWFAGNSETVSVSSNDVIEIRITTPFTYSKPLIAKRIDADVAGRVHTARMCRGLYDGGFADSVKGAVNDARLDLAARLPGVDFEQGVRKGSSMMKVRRFFGNQWSLAPTTAYVYKDDVLMNAGLSTLPTNKVAISASSNTVMFYQNERWQVAVDVGPEDFLGYPRTLTSLIDGEVYNLTPKGIVK